MAFVLGQAPFVHETVPGQDQLPVIIEMTNGERVVGSFDDRGWQAKLEAAGSPKQGRPPSLLMKLDQPWPGGDRTKTIFSKNVKSWYQETAKEWLRRHHENWTKAGYVKYGEGDDLLFVRAEEAKFAEEAQAWADEAYPPPTAPPVALREDASMEVVAPESPPGLARRWGAHAGIAASGVGLALAVWKFLLSE